MSTPVVPGPGQHWPPAPSTAAVPSPPSRKPVLWWIVAGGALVVTITVGAVALLTSGPSGTDAQPRMQAAATTHPAASTNEPPAATVDTPTPAVTPKVRDFKLTAKITKKECFGSAGCSIQFWVKMAYGGADLSEDDTWIVTYEVGGVEDGPQINTIEVTGDTYSHDETEFASTTSSSKKLTIKVTDVEKQGI